jgi:hypothetical protein
MSDLEQTPSSLSAQLVHLEQPDPSGVLSSTREVVLQARSVSLAYAPLQELARRLVASTSTEAEPAPAALSWPERYHFFDGTRRTVNWMLLLDALNFCFWGAKGQARWQISYKGEILNGYWAEAAALRRAVEEGKPVWDARYLSNIDSQELASIFRGLSAETPEIPLFEERLRIAREVGQVLLERFDGQFSHLVEQVQQSGVELALALAEHFSSFRDVTTYFSQEVRFLKRAQICVADLHGAFNGQSWGSFNDMEQLTIFADYKLPQVLRHYGVLVYTPALAAQVDRQEEFAPGSAEEVEIRAATIWACELLRRVAAQLSEQTLTAATIDQWLWHLGQDADHMQPYHRVRTIYY